MMGWEGLVCLLDAMVLLNGPGSRIFAGSRAFGLGVRLCRRVVSKLPVAVESEVFETSAGLPGIPFHLHIPIQLSRLTPSRLKPLNWSLEMTVST